MTAVPRLSAALRAMIADRSGSAARIQPTRSPPHSTLETEPTATTRVLSAASGGGAACRGAPSMRSARVRSSTTVTRPASAIAARACRRSSGMTVPVGLWPVGIRYATESGARPARSMPVGASPAASAGTTTRSARVPASAFASPGYVGQLASTRAAGSVLMSSQSASCAPAVMTSWPGSVGRRWCSVR